MYMLIVTSTNGELFICEFSAGKKKLLTACGSGSSVGIETD